MRTGKTAAAIFAHDPNRGPLLIVAPLNVRSVWLDWIRRRWPLAEPYVIEGLTYDRARFLNAGIIFAHYDVIRRHTSLGITPGTMVLDECHLLANPRSQRTRACLTFASMARKVICLSGTPQWNRPVGLWALLAACNPGAWGRFHEFGKRYGAPVQNGYGVKYTGSSHEEEFRARTSEVMLVRRWADVQQDLPPITRSVEIAFLGAEQRLLLDRAVEIERDHLYRSAIGETSVFRRLVGETKVALAADLAQHVLDEAQPVVVWTHHREVANAIHRCLEGSILITGNVPIAERTQRLTEWQAGRHPNALVITLAVGQVGIDLSRSHHAVFAELDWTPSVIYQAEMRTFAPSRPMSATYVVADHEIEHALVEAVLSKADDAQRMGLPPTEVALTLAHAFGAETDSASMDQLMRAILLNGERLLAEL
jgi:SWI/SNF-related matrix-associated actin-dependent regulator 1 of chromatin subfamily A